MYITNISLKNFRNYEGLSVKLEDGVNIFYGNNAQGKTNLLESIYLCASGRSQRTHNDFELIKFGFTNAFLQVIVNNNNYIDKIDVCLKRDNKKGIAVNGVNIKKLGDLFGILLTVIFSPEDLCLIKSGPSERRKFMDVELCQLSNIYYYELNQYYKILKQRNSLLKSIKINKSLKDTLLVWDEQLSLHGNKIMKIRKKFTEEISEISSKIHSNITNGKENLTVIYKPNCNEDEFLEKLLKNYDRDILRGTTTVGIHKDDISFIVNDMDVKIYGSQGQQRTASLSAKLAEIELIKSKKNKVPILLLDDVLSELDEDRQHYLLKSIKDLQTIITCTGVEDVLKKINFQYNLYKVEDGKIVFIKK